MFHIDPELLERTAESIHAIVANATAVRGERFGCLVLLVLDFGKLAHVASVMTMHRPDAELLQHLLDATSNAMRAVMNLTDEEAEELEKIVLAIEGQEAALREQLRGKRGH